tara:strand:- start:75 stop:977 length:903 start_codon:yes stop_codon:yes gene_type:complete
MFNSKIFFYRFLFLLLFVIATSFQQKEKVTIFFTKTQKPVKKRVKLPKIDLTHWKVTIPEGNGKGKTFNVEPPEILKYATNETLKPYMYNDSVRGALVFYAYPSNSTTANTKFSRSELREQMVPGDDNVNWTFKQGGRMKGTLAMGETTRDAKGKYHRTIIMQIHGRLTNEQRDLIGQKDNNAPPILKIYWDNGKIRVKTKVLKNLNATIPEILYKDAWDNDRGFNFEQKVGFRKFTLEVKVSEGKMVIVLNNSEYKVYKNVHIKKWGVFENYFKAGNYFQSTAKGSFSRIKYYKLEVSH